jgi:hypothetical protein
MWGHALRFKTFSRFATFQGPNRDGLVVNLIWLSLLPIPVFILLQMNWWMREINTKQLLMKWTRLLQTWQDIKYSFMLTSGFRILVFCILQCKTLWLWSVCCTHIMICGWHYLSLKTLRKEWLFSMKLQVALQLACITKYYHGNYEWSFSDARNSCGVIPNILCEGATENVDNICVQGGGIYCCWYS